MMPFNRRATFICSWGQNFEFNNQVSKHVPFNTHTKKNQVNVFLLGKLKRGFANACKHRYYVLVGTQSVTRHARAAFIAPKCCTQMTSAAHLATPSARTARPRTTPSSYTVRRIISGWECAGRAGTPNFWFAFF